MLSQQARLAMSPAPPGTTILVTVSYLVVFLIAYAATPPGQKREQLRERLAEIARDELANAAAALSFAEVDSRLGSASEGGGVQRGGLFTPALIRHKIGLLEDVLERQLTDPAK